ncbi:MAG: ArsR/SmtB family transcription factor [Anaerolineae bacterium]
MDSMLVALSEPNRTRIVEVLRAGPRSVNELVEELHLTQPLVSKHLRVLREAGIVRVRPNAQRRLYELEPGPFRELNAWVSTFRRLWEDRLETLDDRLQQMKREQVHKSK